MDEEAVTFYNLLITMAGFLALALHDGFATGQAVTTQPGAWLWLVGLGIMAAITTPFYYAALQRMMVWKFRAILLLNPLVVALAEWWLWGIHLHHLQWLGAAMILVGALALIWDEARSNLAGVERIGEDSTP